MRLGVKQSLSLVHANQANIRVKQSNPTNETKLADLDDTDDYDDCEAFEGALAQPVNQPMTE